MELDNYLKNGKFHFKILDTNLKIAVQNFNAEERISAPYEVNLHLVSEDKIHFNDVIQQEALLTIDGNQGVRYFHGIINHFMLMGKGGRFYFYQAWLAPDLWKLSLDKDYRSFQNMTTEEIIKKVLEENDILSDCYEFRLAHEYRKRRYCTQYGESDFHFVSRLLEEDGIFYFFEHSREKHLLVFADDETAYLPILGENTMHMHHEAGMVGEKEIIESFCYLRSVCPGVVTQTNYNFKRPSLPLKVQKEGNSHENYEVYEYPGPYGYPEDGEKTARVRLEENKALEQLAQGSGNCGRFTPGHTYNVTNHEFDDLNKEYVLVSVKHTGEQTHVTGEYTGIGGDFTYSNEFFVIPASVVYRPEKVHKKPIVCGLQPAVVVGPKGEEIYVDEFCRVKVQFPWDRKGQNDEKSSCWVRVLQKWGGGGWGSVFIPRVGDEVFIEFQNGDPDWPILVGSVYNGKNIPLYNLNQHKTRTVIKTRSYPHGDPDNYNELRFEDRKGHEEVFLQGEKDWNILIKNDKGQYVGHDETLNVRRNRAKTVGVDQSETIGANKTINVGANHVETIGSNMNLTVGSCKTEFVAINTAETIGAAKELSVGAAYAVTVGGAMNTAVGLGQFEEVGLSKKIVVGNRLDISAGDKIEIICGKSQFSMDQDGNIILRGSNIDISASGNITIKGRKVSTNG